MSEKELVESLEKPAECEEDSNTGVASGMPTEAAGDNVRKAAAELIERYYFQIQNGCGSSSCDNPYCASSGNVLFKVGCLTSDEAAVTALRLFTERAQLCSIKGISNEKISQVPLSKKQSIVPEDIPTIETDSDMDVGCSSSANSGSNNSVKNNNCDDSGINIDKIRTTIDECELNGNYAPLRILVRRVFSNEVVLKNSFMVDKNAPKPHLIDTEGIDSEIQSLNIRIDGSRKEDVRAAESDLDKDIDCHEESMQEDKEMAEVGNQTDNSKKVDENWVLDICEVKQAYDLLLRCPKSEFHFTLIDTCQQLLRDTLNFQFKVFPQKYMADPKFVRLFIIIFENPDLVTPDYTEVLGELCWCVSQLNLDQQASLVRHLASWGNWKLRQLLENMHQLITIRLLSTHFSKDYTINDEITIISATKTMNLVYYASIYGGKWDEPLLLEIPPEDICLRDAESDHFATTNKESWGRPPEWDSLGKLLGIHPLDAREPLVPLHEFYDDFLSDQLEIDRDFAYFKSANTDKFTFLNFPFILTPATKSLGLYYDNRVRMHSERRISIYQSFIHGQATSPYLNLRIKRDHIIEDALIELELIAMENPIDLKKQLVVEFENEQGIDEGGVSKEFFQLIIEQLFNPDYAMFVLNSETKTFWFNPTSFENDAQFTLVGILLGLAIYNNIILDLHFPPVIYKKLCGKPGSFHDLKEWNKTLYSSLNYMLEYEENDMEDVFVQSFCVGYEDIFGASLKHDLIPQGTNILVNQSNKLEFVNMYADFLLNKSVERQFFAFKKGFLMVTDDSPLMQLFRPEELELLVCGSNNYDFVELKKSTEYESGYTPTTPMIEWFWEIVDQLPTEDKKLLLQFTTGSARVPVGGLARLKLTISRHGPDTDRLPTAHTCFNVLLLPEYSSKEKLKDRLLKAINYAEGFGML